MNDSSCVERLERVRHDEPNSIELWEKVNEREKGRAEIGKGPKIKGKFWVSEKQLDERETEIED